MKNGRYASWARVILTSVLLAVVLVGSDLFVHGMGRNSVAHADSTFTTITPGTTTTPLVNPGKGWVLYWGKGFGSSGSLSSSDIPPYTSVVYDRLEWSQLEPTEGNYNWSLIDGEIQQASQFGLKYAFGVMNADSSDCPNGVGNVYVTPKWVFDDGAQFTASTVSDNNGCPNFTQDEPVWTDPIYLQKLNTFLQALAQRYDGNPNIAFIDDCSYGNFGEQHVGDLSGSTPLTTDQLESQMQTQYLDNFRSTQIEVATSTENSTSVYQWAVQHGIGLRNEGVPNYTNGSSVALAQGYAPGVVEFGYDYTELSAQGLWNTQTVGTDILTDAQASYCEMGFAGSDANNMYNNNSQWVASMLNQMGYYFQLTSATLPTTLYTSGTNAFSLNWANNGVSSLYQPSATVAVALLDSNNNVVQQQVFPGSHPRAWTPGQTTTETSSLSFSGVNPGTYQLAVGILRTASDTNPTYLIGNTGQTTNKWYVIDTSINVSNGTGGGTISGANLVQNAGFETGDLSGWTVWVPNGQSPSNAAIEAGGHSGTYRMAQYSPSPFQASVYQTVSNLANGTYSLSAWVESSGKSNMQVYDQPGGNVLTSTPLPNTSSWQQVSLNVTLTGGQATLTFATNGGAGDWLRVDDVSFALSTPTSANLVQNPGFETGDLTDWNVWVPNGQSTSNAFVEQGGYNSTYRLAEWNASSAFQVTVFQQLANVTNGTYTASAWIESSGASQMIVRNQEGGTVLAQMAAIPSSSSWQQISLTVNITGGQAEIEFYTNGAANVDFLRVDDVSFVPLA